ncbi:hypothetical protein [Peribacillus kribbensis]|uniref:hypothetical protein n=1 Tax=Peribacillus kribbensis TaxID=356658 RepID=UPI00040E5B65|nr:hypothetical protein [Peribacillus kribbensis]
MIEGGDSVPRVFIPQLVDYYKASQFPFDKLVKFYDFEELNEAFEDSKKVSPLSRFLGFSHKKSG